MSRVHKLRFSAMFQLNHNRKAVIPPYSPSLSFKLLRIINILWCILSNVCMPRLWSCSVAVILPQHPTYSHADAGDVIASHLPKWKNLRKVEVYSMNPVPILWATVSCGKLAEVVIWDPKHCKVSFSEL